MLPEHYDLLRAVIEHHGGCVIKTMGDAVVAAFDNCDESIRAAISMQRPLKERPMRSGKNGRRHRSAVGKSPFGSAPNGSGESPQTAATAGSLRGVP